MLGVFAHKYPLKNMTVSWDDYSQYMESHKIPWFQTTNQIYIIANLRYPTKKNNFLAGERR